MASPTVEETPVGTTSATEDAAYANAYQQYYQSYAAQQPHQQQYAVKKHQPLNRFKQLLKNRQDFSDMFDDPVSY